MGDVHISVEQFAAHLETTIQALHDSTTQLTDSFKSVPPDNNNNIVIIIIILTPIRRRCSHTLLSTMLSLQLCAIAQMLSAGLILLGILFVRCQLSIRNSCFSECMTASLLRYSNEWCAQRIALCAVRILLTDFA